MTEHPDITQLSAHLDGELDSANTARISGHLLSCQACQWQYRDLRELSNDVRQLPMLEPELDMVALLGQLPERQIPVPSDKRWHPAVPGIAVAAAMILGLFIGTHLHSPIPSTTPSFAALAILDSTPPGALCRQPELCYLQGNLR